MRILITGINGFVGKHLARHLLGVNSSAEIHGTVRSSGASLAGVQVHHVDLRDEHRVRDLITTLRPQQIYHLAAQSFVPRSFEAPWETLENNIRAQLNIVLACLELDTMPRILTVSSAEVYGAVSADQVPMHENLAPHPTSPYSVSKVTQEMMALQYQHSHQLPIMCARPFNHFGPGQNERFVTPAFAMQVARIAAGLQSPVIEVGDLTAQRDFTDVRDIVRAYSLIIDKGTPGTIYNVASGQAQSIQHLLDTLVTFADADIQVKTVPERLRPVKVPILLGDATRLQQATGWAPAFTFEASLRDIYEDCRMRVAEADARAQSSRS